MYLSVNVKPHSDETGIIYDLSVHEDCSSLQTQFEVLLVDGVAQGVLSPLCDAYNAIGITLFFQESHEKLKKDKTLTDVEEDVNARLVELKEANFDHRLKVMLEMLNFKDIVPKDSIKLVEEILRKDDEGKWWTLDLHIHSLPTIDLICHVHIKYNL
ncbi:PREDICTED: uncharacterized protein LOC109593413 [Amphimedon queenslandica]|uniref:Uncharacterized protein n=2 Tax=Amphimedon queenslandica TaxID=400682 RepID=A0AAN0K4H3_AMPQE|nr:PREDICTED: uncharacterized protein LOC109593413 [Amphimedon queenslandica]|eukprot:XP_019864062.1 PREDICTED: uncharacterized protein LOC109593413 [Amphimedon queenslandica]